MQDFGTTSVLVEPLVLKDEAYRVRFTLPGLVTFDLVPGQVKPLIRALEACLYKFDECTEEMIRRMPEDLNAMEGKP